MVLDADFKARAMKLLELKRKLDALQSSGTLEPDRLSRLAQAFEASTLDIKALNLRMADKIISDNEIKHSALTAAPGNLNLSEYRSRLGEMREIVLKQKAERKEMESYTADDYINYLRSKYGGERLGGRPL